MVLRQQRRGWGFHQLLRFNSDQIARYDFKDVPLDYVIFRELTRNNYYESERVMYWLKANHKICVNTDVAGRRSCTSDKHFQQGLFLLDPFLKDFALPTYEAKSKSNVMSYIRGKRVHFPIVLKDRHGTTGKNITLVRDEAELDQIQDFGGLVIEQYIEPECDFRVFVMGGVAIGAMRKKGNTDNMGDFVSWSAGWDKHLETDPEVLDILSEIATRAAAISHLEYTGVDILRAADTGKYYLLETNIAAGWPNFISVTHINIPDLVLDWMADRAAARTQDFATAVQQYLERRRQYLPRTVQETVAAIEQGRPDALRGCSERFAQYEVRYSYDAGNIYARLSHAYENDDEALALMLVNEIEAMPFSWAGNFIGPELGTFHDGAILSALYLHLLHKLGRM